MVKMEISLYGALARATGEKNFEVEGSSLKEVLETLTKLYGEPFGNRIYNRKGKINRHVNIYVNGKDIRFLDNIDTKLKKGDKIAIMAAIGGG